MTIALSTVVENKILDWLINNVAMAAGTNRQLGLYIDGSGTEVTDGAYSRYNLTLLAAAASGELSDSLTISVGAQTATHWKILDNGTMLAEGALDDSFTGSTTIDVLLEAMGA